MKRRAGSRLHSTSGLLLSALFLVVTGTSCSKGLPTAPVTGDSGMNHNTQMATTTASINWLLLATQSVGRDPATMLGGRYQLAFARGSLSSTTQVTISERDPLVTDVLVGPASTTLSKEATLTISYTGSNADPGLSFGMSPKLYRLNESTGAWELVAGTNDPVLKRFTAKITKLGRYGLSLTDPGRASW